ncbi:MAG: RNA polymerase sigma factor [Bacteroidota bacterium]
MDSKSLNTVCDQKVFDKIYEDNADDLFKFLYYKYGPGNNPHDLVQEAFIKLWDNCHKVPPEKARGFLFTVANNQTLSQIARDKTALKYAEAKPKDYSSESPEFKLLEKEYKERLETALNELSEEQRVTFMLNRVEGKKHQEIANMLGISRKAVEKRIYTALNKLRSKIENI